jgi:hypothetical protein
VTRATTTITSATDKKSNGGYVGTLAKKNLRAMALHAKQNGLLAVICVGLGGVN